MYETLCTYPLPSDLFAQAIHPSTPLIGVGLASGHVQAFRLPSLGTSSESSPADDDDDDDQPTPPAPDGRGTIDTTWQTRRHKGSCRALAFSSDGEQLISAGSEGIVKVASAETGKVQWKIAVPDEDSTPTAPSLLHALSPQTLLLATDTSALHIYDTRAASSPSTNAPARPAATHRPHDDYVSSLTPLPPTDASTSGFSKQWVSTGGGTLAVTDLRRGVMARSEDQEDELLSSVHVTGLGRRGTSVGEKILVGGNTGVLTLWEKGVWDDQDERIVVDRGDRRAKVEAQSCDVLVEVPGGVGGSKAVAVGLDGGTVRFVALGRNQVVGEVRHDDLEGVVGLGFECEGRMVSGGGSVVKVWQEGEGVVNGDLEVAMRKRDMESEEEGDASGSDSDDSDEGEKGRKRRKKRKRSKGKDRSGGKAVVSAFKGLD